ncbi:MAG: glycerophosphodiester phosphodiesterase family protein [bacterium]
MKKCPPVVAHRGLARLFPENTRASVLGALHAGLRMMEIDIQLSCDGVPLLQHDTNIERMSGRKGDIRALPIADLRRLRQPEPGRFGRRFSREPLAFLASLARVLAREPRFTLFVELKEESLKLFGRERMLGVVAEALAPIRRRCVLISFDLAVLRLARANTGFPVGPVLRSLAQWGPEARVLKPEWVFCDRHLLPKRGSLGGLFPRANLVVYEVSDAVSARALLRRGVFAVETFRADSLAQELTLFR